MRLRARLETQRRRLALAVGPPLAILTIAGALLAREPLGGATAVRGVQPAAAILPEAI